MTEYRSENPGANFPAEYLDPTKVYDPKVMLPLFQNGQIPPEIEAVIGPWMEAAKELEFEEFRKNINDQCVMLAHSDPAQPVNILVAWRNGMGGLSAAAMLNLWLSELLSLKNSPNDYQALARQCTNALSDRSSSRIYEDAYNIARALWKSRLSERQTHRKLNNWLADHVASHLWGCSWLHKRNFPQSVRTSPTAQEQKSKAVMNAWATMPATEAARDAELEKIFGERARQLPGYNPDHPLAVAVKIQIDSPSIPAPGNKAFSFVITILPLVIHHHWSLVDIANCMEIACPRLAIITRSREAEGQKGRLNDYVGRHILGPMGLRKVIDPQGRHARNSRPGAWGSARLTALSYLNASF